MFQSLKVKVPKLGRGSFGRIASYLATITDDMEVDEKISRLRLIITAIHVSMNQYPLSTEDWERLALPAAALTREVLEFVRRRSDIIVSPGGQELVAEVVSTMLMKFECSKSLALKVAISDENKIAFLEIVTWPLLELPKRIQLLKDHLGCIIRTPVVQDHEEVKTLLVNGLRGCSDIEYQELILEFLFNMSAHNQHGNDVETGSEVSIEDYIGDRLNLPPEVLVIDLCKYFLTTRRFLNALNALPSPERVMSLPCALARVGEVDVLTSEEYGPMWFDLSPVSKNMRLEYNSLPNEPEERRTTVTFALSNLRAIFPQKKFRAERHVASLTFILKDPVQLTLGPKKVCSDRFKLWFEQDELFIEAENNFFTNYYGLVYGNPEPEFTRRESPLGPLLDSSVSAIEKASNIVLSSKVSSVCSHRATADGKYVVTSTPIKPNHPTNIIVNSSVNQDLRDLAAIVRERARQVSSNLSFAPSTTREANPPPVATVRPNVVRRDIGGENEDEDEGGNVGNRNTDSSVDGSYDDVQQMDIDDIEEEVDSPINPRIQQILSSALGLASEATNLLTSHDDQECGARLHPYFLDLHGLLFPRPYEDDEV